MGFEVFIFSNSPSNRLEPFEKELNVKAFSGSMKPLKKGYKKVLNMYDKDKCVFIGDQIMTDVIGAKRNGLYVIFIDRINMLCTTLNTIFDICTFKILFH